MGFLNKKYSNKYNKLVINQLDYEGQLNVIRDGFTINPLEAFNFVNAKIYSNNESITINKMINEHKYYIDNYLQPINSFLSINDNGVYVKEAKYINSKTLEQLVISNLESFNELNKNIFYNINLE